MTRSFRLLLVLTLTACATGTDDATAPALEIATVADTTTVRTPDADIDRVHAAEEVWTLADDALHVGTVTAAALGQSGAIWIAVTESAEHAAIYRVGEAGMLEVVAQDGRTPGGFTAPLTLLALADGGLLAVETSTGAAVRYDAAGAALDTLQLRPLDGRTLWPDQHGGWFRRGDDATAWLRHDPLGAVTDTLRVSTAWPAAPGHVDGIARDGSLLRADASGRQLDRLTKAGPVLRSTWNGDALAGEVQLAHDAGGGVWLGDQPTPDTERWRRFARDGSLQFVFMAPEGTEVLDRDGEFVLARQRGPAGASGLVVWRLDTPTQER